MCGIAGATGPGADLVARRLSSALAHRGPDSSGCWSGPGVSLAHTRLAILDPSPRSDQPFRLGPLTLVYNGEIYNYLELRRELEAAGHRFSTSGDTEVLAKLWFESGVGSLDRAQGMFAFAVWDSRDESINLGRDRHGIKPLYWRPRRRGLEWASEVSALDRGTDTVDSAALREFLRFGAPITGTIVDGVSELAPGTVLRADARGINIHRFAAARNNAAEPDAIEAIHTSISQHARADRPLALLLSGGFDSAAILRGLVGAGVRPLCLTLATGHNAEDVSRARATAQNYGADHEVVVVDDSTLSAKIPGFLAAMDQPGIDGFNTYLISEICRSFDRSVALSGLGGDEVFGGYRYYKTEAQLDRIAPIVHRAPDRLLAAGAQFLAAATGRSRTRIDAVLRGRSVAERHRGFRTLFSDAEVKNLTGCCPKKSVRWDTDHDASNRRQLAELDATTYLRPTLLRDADVYSMWHGVELRTPFVDTRVINSVLGQSSAPTKLDIAHRWNDQFLVQKATEPKLTFRLPWQQWLSSNDDVQETVRSAPDPWNGLLRADAAHQILDHDDGTAADPLRRWSLIVLAHWLNRSRRTPPSWAADAFADHPPHNVEART